MLDSRPETPSENAELRRALEAADPATLLLSLVQLTGERHWLEAAKPFIRGPMSYQEFMPEPLRAQVRDRLADVLAEIARGGKTRPRQADDALLREMMAVATGEVVPDDYIAMMREDLTDDTLASRSLKWRRPPSPEVLQGAEVVIVGAGMSGLYAGIQLQQAGIPFVILEKNAAVGGTWYENTYPGCGVDTPNHFYSYAFEPNHDWSHFFAKRDELWNYFEKVADKYDLRKQIRFATEVVDASYDEASASWRITAQGADGTRQKLVARVLVSAVGVLNRPKLPDIEGLASFAGPAFHTAQWDRHFDWRGIRVAMIGTGASGHQVGPSIAPEVAQLMIFQRSPHWVVPNPNYHEGVSEGKKWALANIPFYLRWYRFQLFWGFADGLHAALQVDPDWPHPKRSLNALNEKHRLFMEKHMRSELAGRPDLLEKVIPDLSGLWQTHPDRQSLVQDAHAPQCRSRHRPDRIHRAGGHTDKRRADLAGGCAGVRHRFSGQQDAAADDRHRKRRPQFARGLGPRRRQGLSRPHRSRLSEFLHADRTEHCPRPWRQPDLHDRMQRPAHDAGVARNAGGRPSLDRMPA
jgi:4-hydroxyacetophenone monooxygenase